MRTVKDFMVQWNYWREFYLDLGPIQPKTKAQLTVIEDAIEFANKNDLKLPILIGAVHKAYLKRNFRPSYNVIVAYGLKWYEQFYEDILSDLDRAEYEEKSSDRT